jgi:hypothetical protein
MARRDELEARHIFHHRHRRAFVAGIALAAAALAVLQPRIQPAAVELYLIEGAMLAAWFIILHATSSAHRLPKEIAVGVFFSAAIFIPTVARAQFVTGSRQRIAPLLIAILFGALCSLNCLCIHVWEHKGGGFGGRPAHGSTRFAIAHLTLLARAIAVAGAALAAFELLAVHQMRRADIPIACTLAAVLLLALDRNRRRLSRLDLRAAADLALLTPLLFLPALR